MFESNINIVDLDYSNQMERFDSVKCAILKSHDEISPDSLITIEQRCARSIDLRGDQGGFSKNFV